MGVTQGETRRQKSLPAAAAATRVPAPGQPCQFVTRGSKKPSPTRHKTSSHPCSLKEARDLTSTKIIHADTPKHRSHPSQARETPRVQKTLPRRPPIVKCRRNRQEKRNLPWRQKKYTHLPSATATRFRPKHPPAPHDPNPNPQIPIPDPRPLAPGPRPLLLWPPVDNSNAIAPAGTADHRAALLAGYLGWTLDAFDFFLVVSCLTAIGREFHKSDAEMALTLTATLAFRPVGAFLFGLLADRYGRRLPLMIDLVFYSVIEVALGPGAQLHHLPDSPRIVRHRHGRRVGRGRFSGHGKGARRACAACSPASSSRAMPSAICWPRSAISSCSNDSAGVRCFSSADCPALLAFFVRFRVKESEVWQKTRQKTWGDLVRGILSHWKLFLYLVVLMTAMNLASHGTQDMYPTFLERQWHLLVGQRNLLSAFTMVGAIFGGTLCGMLSDRFGRRRVISLALLGAVLVIPLWAFAPSVRASVCRRAS